MFPISIESLSLILLVIDGIKACSLPYVSFINGCYKIASESRATWQKAREICESDKEFADGTKFIGKSHLAALENYMERYALTTLMKNYSLDGEYWIDGIVGTSTWSWSNNSIEWFFEVDERNVSGSGQYYKLISGNTSRTGYLISDENAAQELKYVCEYQVKAPLTKNECQNDGISYTNVGFDVCVCVDGFTGKKCEIDIDDCLSSPCLHGGNCTDRVNNYTCDCSETFYEGDNCDTLKLDPKESNRVAAFWSVVGVISGLILLLIISDLPWSDICPALGYSCDCCKCCGKENRSRLIDSPTNDFNSGGRVTPISYANTGSNHQSMRQKSSDHVQYNGYHSPDHTRLSQKSNMNPYKNISFITTTEPRAKGKDPVDSMVNWTQQLQAQLKTKNPRPGSGSSTKQLIHSTDSYT